MERDANGRWIPGSGSPNPKGRPSGSGELRDLLSSRQEEIVNKVIALALDGDTSALKLCLERILPVLRPESTKINLSQINHHSALGSKAESVFAAISNGELDPDTGIKLMHSIQFIGKARQIDELEDRLQKLEERLKQGYSSKV